MSWYTTKWMKNGNYLLNKSQTIEPQNVIVGIDYQEVVDLSGNREGSKTKTYLIISGIEDKLQSLNQVRIQHA